MDVDGLVSETLPLETVISNATEAVHLAAYQFNDFKSSHDHKRSQLDALTLYTTADNDGVLSDAAATGKALALGTNTARTLVNNPANHMTPSILADHARDIAERHGMSFEVLDKEDMERLGMGALLAVNQGSDEPPKLMVLKYQGKSDWSDVLTFVGKGITFDAGGYSLKTPKGMVTMKSDMGGSAAALGAMDTIGYLQPEANVMVVVPSTENLVNGSAVKPGDVITAYNGQTVEVVNTDAEGRLVLADALAYSRELGADYLVDIATLTGAVVAALGHYTTGVVANDDDFYKQVQTASDLAGEWIWRFPHHKPYQDMIRHGSHVADLVNAPGGGAGSITAGMFLQQFVADTPWVHLDIAGTAFSDQANDLGPKGATGVMTRTLALLTQ